MERVLHRANTRDRIRRGIEAGCDRLEVDVWYRGGEFHLTHDPSVGSFVVGPNGVALRDDPPGRASWIRRVDGFVTLPDLVALQGAPSLLVDLKGWWPDAALRELAAVLEGRTGDAVTAPMAAVVERYRRIAPGVLAMYGARQAAERLLPRVCREAPGRVAVSARAEALARNGGAERVRRWKDVGARVYAWHFSDLGTLRRVAGLGIDGAIVHEPAWLRALEA